MEEAASMNRITLAEAIRKYYAQRGLAPEEAEARAAQVRSRLLEMGKASADIHLHDFYFVAFQEDGEFYVDSDHFALALEDFRSLRRGGGDN